jgi:hypothetical protein
MNRITLRRAAPNAVSDRYRRQASACFAASAKVVVTFFIAYFSESQLVGQAIAADERHAFAIERMAVVEAVKAGDASATLDLSCQCPVDGDYVVVMLYNGDLKGIDAQVPQLKRPFAGSVAVAMGVSLSVTVTDVESGIGIRPKPIAPTVFDATTKKQRWSGERLAVFQLRGGGDYRVVVTIKDMSPVWMSLDPVVLMDPSEEVIKAMASEGADPRL